MKLLNTIASGALDERLRTLYGTADHTRAERIIAAFAARFPAHAEEAALFSAPGRTEIGGNHTDHQHGRVLCGSVDLDMLACAAPNGTKEIRIFSEGYGETCVMLDELKPVEAGKDTTDALVRGVAAGVSALGYDISGFDA